MAGMSATEFGPRITTERAMIVTILYRLEGEPAVTGESGFTDVLPDQYYTKAVTWAAQKGIAAGYGNGIFLPNKTITRQEMAAFFYRYAVWKGYTANQDGNIQGILDARDIDAYAMPAMNWAISNGFELDTENMILPKAPASRAELAVFLNRFSDAYQS